ncbi:MAG: substrate-binding domain-containing protein [Candidatus Adiutrix sp.]|nr:substrate-binding domain-containing protein [Candidatus Adiutrix sp.]
MAGKITWQIIRLGLTVLTWLAGGYLLNSFEYFTAFAKIDNIFGMLPVALALVVASAVSLLLWMKHSRRKASLSAAVATVTVAAILIFPTALRKDWWLQGRTVEGTDDRPDLSLYVPFSPISQTAKLGEEATVKLAGEAPVLDGATALYPVYAAFAEAVYDRKTFSQNTVLCDGTRNAYEALIQGKRDIIFVAAPSAGQIKAAQNAGADLRFTPIGWEAFVFLAGKDNPVDSLSHQEIRNIFSGKSAHWRTFGWAQGGPVIAFMRPEGSGSQTGLAQIMGGLPIQTPQPLPDASLMLSSSLLKQVSVRWRGVQPAIGYSYRYFATTMYANPEAKLLKINGVAPTIENIRNGSYPFTANFYAVTLGSPKPKAKLLIDWILSPQGQELIEKTGYVPISR